MTDDITAAQIAADEALCAAATPLPWHLEPKEIRGEHGEGVVVPGVPGTSCVRYDNAAYIVAACNHLPKYITALKAAREQANSASCLWCENVLDRRDPDFKAKLVEHVSACEKNPLLQLLRTEREHTADLRERLFAMHNTGQQPCVCENCATEADAQAATLANIAERDALRTRLDAAEREVNHLAAKLEAAERDRDAAVNTAYKNRLECESLRIQQKGIEARVRYEQERNDTLHTQLASAQERVGELETELHDQLGTIITIRDKFDRAEARCADRTVAERTTAELRAQVEELRDGRLRDRRVYFYEREFYPLSNFAAFNLKWGSKTFPTSEHAYHWNKFPDYVSVQLSIEVAPSAHAALKIAEANKPLVRPDWEQVRVPIMREILTAKANQHEYVRRKLLETGTADLIENSWRDAFWGWGPKQDGQNMLGKLWMEVRAALLTPPDAGKETK